MGSYLLGQCVVASGDLLGQCVVASGDVSGPPASAGSERVGTTGIGSYGVRITGQNLRARGLGISCGGTRM